MFPVLKSKTNIHGYLSPGNLRSFWEYPAKTLKVGSKLFQCGPYHQKIPKFSHHFTKIHLYKRIQGFLKFHQKRRENFAVFYTRIFLLSFPPKLFAASA